MPMKNFHSARLLPPDFKQWGYTKNFFGTGVDVVWGVRNGKSKIQAIRFRKDTFSSAQVRRWVLMHKFKPVLVEYATKENPMKRVRLNQPKLADALESIIDREGFSHVMHALEHVAYAKAIHLAENWQDNRSAKVYEKLGGALDKVGAFCENYSL